ncbi:unnamed protein product, partial [marine sediment metagenome]
GYFILMQFVGGFGIAALIALYVMLAQLALLNSLFVLAVGLWGMVRVYETPWNQFAAMAILYAIPWILFFLMAQRYLRAGLAMGGVKG